MREGDIPGQANNQHEGARGKWLGTLIKFSRATKNTLEEMKLV
jgi:hypothetical protein